MPLDRRHYREQLRSERERFYGVVKQTVKPQANLAVIVRSLAGNVLIDTLIDRTWTGMQLAKYVISVVPPANRVHYCFLYRDDVLHPNVKLQELVGTDDVDRIEVTACAQDKLAGKYLSTVLTEDIVYYLCVDITLIEFSPDTTVTCACLSRCRRWLHGTWERIGGKIVASFTRMDIEIARETKDIRLTLEFVIEASGSLKLVKSITEESFEYSHWIQPGFVFTYEAEDATEDEFQVNIRDVELVESQIDFCKWPRSWVIRVLHCLQHDIVEAIMLITDYELGLLERNLERARRCAASAASYNYE